MKNMQAQRQKHILCTLFVALICVLCIFVLAACDTQNEDVTTTEREYMLFYSGLSYSKSDETIYVLITMQSLGEDVSVPLESRLSWTSDLYNLDTWYRQQDIEMLVDSSGLYAEVDALISHEQRVQDDIEYKLLKLVLRYDTIYKSIKSDATVVRSDGKYLHRFRLDEELEAQTFEMHYKSPRAASWYSMLIACGIVFAAALVGVSLAIKGGVCQKKKNKSE